MAQCTPNAKSEVAGIRIHKTRRDATISTMAMNQRKFIFTHLPGLLQNHAKNSVEHDFSRMVAMKVDFHLLPSLESQQTRCHEKSNNEIIGHLPPISRSRFI
ncbi:MAG: hypothetical protein QOJ41_2703 [Acidobacteriaceae bacterium]|nr:hypothetical protein [Acidobacteriaceae bacterium]